MIKLPSSIRPGLIRYPGRTPQSKCLTEQLLERDREAHHCFFNLKKFHNHLSHHILAAYDLGASAPLLQSIYDSEKTMQMPIDMQTKEKTIHEVEVENITQANWTAWLGDSRYYASYLVFFTAQVATHGSGKTIEKYVFADSANANEAYMLIRFVGGLYHPLIQTGYGVEFGSDAMVAQGLAVTAVSDAKGSILFDCADDAHNQQQGPLALFDILRQVYDSPILKPVMPYDPNALISKRRMDACKDGRPAEIRRLAALWWAPPSTSTPVPITRSEIDHKVQELFYFSTLLLVGTSKPGRVPRLDFNLMHILTATLFVPPILAILESPNKERFLQAMMVETIMQVITRGRPRVNPALVMQDFTPLPRPPVMKESLGGKDALGTFNPWPAIIEEATHAPEAHIVKAIRSLCYAAQLYGETPAGSVPGAFRVGEEKNGGKQVKEETHVGMGALDGTLFVRAAGVIMDVLGWVTYGKEAGNWDRSCLGYEEAWV